MYWLPEFNRLPETTVDLYMSNYQAVTLTSVLCGYNVVPYDYTEFNTQQLPLVTRVPRLLICT